VIWVGIRAALRPVLAVGSAISLTMLDGCAGHQQSAVDAAGPQAGRIETLWWLFLAILGAVFVIVMALTAWTLTKRHRGFEQEPLERTHLPSQQTEARLTRVVTAATVATVVILFVLLVSSILTGKRISDFANRKDPLVIEVTGQQWWWQIRYQNSDPLQVLVTANELHIPVGRPILMRGTSLDVIHSFWVPNLHGKRDLIPSRITTEWIEADHPGVFRGQCAEFCGLQHAHMILWVVAEPEDKFEAWFKRQLQPAAAPSNPILQHGQQVFVNNACVYCHAIRGTAAAGQNAPDLTHFGQPARIGGEYTAEFTGQSGGMDCEPTER
jgi:cytochrome c oxidase subunit 2